MSPRFFIDRPIFSWVLALGITLAGVLALRGLPIEQYPEIAPPSLSIRVTYPGADAQVLANNVTQVIEQELNGVEGFIYMTSTSESNGTATITVTFRPGTNIDVASMDVQNRMRRVEPRLPEEVRRQGIQVNKAGTGFLMLVALTSKSGTTPTLELGNFAVSRVVDELRRIPGVGDIRSFASEYAMRVWLDPDRLASYRMSPADALAAIREQNSQTTGGSLGDRPLAEGSELNAAILTQSRFTTAQEFAAIILRANPDGSVVRLGDVARVELGAQSYLASTELNGKPVAGIAVQLLTGANALDVSEGVKTRMAELAENFPPDIGWAVPFDTTPFIEASVESVIATLVEAMLLVFLVMFLFLQNWRATLIPTIVVPISLAGACVGLAAFGFSINVLTLFAMVMAIGILVDDAIVVIENVERIMEEEGLPPYEATVRAMSQITSAIVGITLVLVTVFLPMAFFPGSSGAIYRQFSVTLAVSIAFSALMALTLTPALCATLLRPHAHAADAPGSRVGGIAGRFFARFNRWFARSSERYQGQVARILARPLRVLAIFALLVAMTVVLYRRLPGSFLPSEDQGNMLTVVQAPPGATTERTDVAIEQTKAFFRSQPQVRNILFIRGFSFFGQGQANAMAFVTLKPWDERPGRENSVDALVARALRALSQIKEAMVFSLNLPPIQGLGTAGGWTFKLEDRGGHAYEELLAARNQLLARASQSPVLAGVRPEGQEDAPQLRVRIDRIKARALGRTIGDVNNTLAIAFGSAYANDFARGGRILRVLVAADAPYRMTPQDVLDLRVRNAEGEMVPFGAFTSVEWTAGPPQVQRYNAYPAMTISGTAAPGRSTGEALAEMERFAAQLPAGFGYDWTGIAYEEKQSAGQVGALLGLSLVVVFLVLAALYESWTVPIAVLLVVPLGVLGSVLFTMGRGLAADIYFNVGLLTIIGLSAKNAILIAEFAIEEEARGRDLLEATLSATRLRLRPIIMTSLAFILGMVPLVRATGASAASRIAVGTGVAGGMLAGTVLGIFFIPLFYVAVRRWLSRGRPRAPGGAVAGTAHLLAALALPAGAVAVLAGCAVGPRYKPVPPEGADGRVGAGEASPAARAFFDSLAQVRAADSTGPRTEAPRTPEAFRADTLGDLAWLDLFRDTVLITLVRTALRQNRDLQAAVARIREFRAQAAVARAPLFPSLTLNGTATTSRSDIGIGTPITLDAYQVTGNLAWELDLWGRTRRSLEAARADVGAQEAARRAVALSLVSDVAVGYLQLLELDQERAVAESTLVLRRATLALAQSRLAQGITSELDVRQFEAQVGTTAATLAQIERQRAQQEHQLSVLVGSPPMRIPRGGSLAAAVQALAVPDSLPATLLARRPDVRQAERALAAATARIGAAEAARFPAITITGYYGAQAPDLGDLFGDPGEIYQLRGGVALPLFTGGQLVNAVRAARARVDQARAAYQQTALLALAEAGNALAGVRTARNEVVAQATQARALRRALYLAEVRYRGGVASYLEVLDAQRSLFGAELALSQAQLNQLAAAVQLYRALGGSWRQE